MSSDPRREAGLTSLAALSPPCAPPRIVSVDILPAVSLDSKLGGAKRPLVVEVGVRVESLWVLPIAPALREPRAMPPPLIFRVAGRADDMDMGLRGDDAAGALSADDKLDRFGRLRLEFAGVEREGGSRRRRLPDGVKSSGPRESSSSSSSDRRERRPERRADEDEDGFGRERRRRVLGAGVIGGGDDLGGFAPMVGRSSTIGGSWYSGETKSSGRSGRWSWLALEIPSSRSAKYSSGTMVWFDENAAKDGLTGGSGEGLGVAWIVRSGENLTGLELGNAAASTLDTKASVRDPLGRPWGGVGPGSALFETPLTGVFTVFSSMFAGGFFGPPAPPVAIYWRMTSDSLSPSWVLEASVVSSATDIDAAGGRGATFLPVFLGFFALSRVGFSFGGAPWILWRFLAGTAGSSSSENA